MNTKSKHTIFSWLSGLVLFLLIFSVFTLLYSPRPDLPMLIEYLEAKSAFLTKLLLDKSEVQFISNSIGVPQLILPSFLFTPLALLKIDNPSILLSVNYLLILTGGHLLVRHFRKNKLSIIFLVLFTLSPIVFTSMTTSVGVGWILFLFSAYLSTKKVWIRNLVAFLVILSSFAAWPLFLMLTLFELFEKEQKKKVFFRLIIILTLIFLLSKSAGANLVDTYFPILKIKNHGFYLDIHRQADFVAGYRVIGRIFYNKYVVVIRKVLEQTVKFFDWDFLVFHTASGKYTSEIPTFALMSIFELPLLLYAIYLMAKKKIKGLKFILITAFCLAIFAKDNLLILTYWLSLSYLLFQTLAIISKAIPKKLFFFYMMLIIFGRLILINQSQEELALLGNRFNIYSELANYLKKADVVNPVFITDRLGQPHIYLTFFNVTSIGDLQQNLSVTTRRDSRGLLQPDNIGEYYFSSFEYENNNALVKNYQKAAYVELEEYFTNLSELDSKGNIHRFSSQIRRRIQDKDHMANLLLYQKQ
jgi:hypothetical protein